MGQTVAQWLKANKGKYKDGDTLKAECIKATGAHRDSVVRVMRHMGIGGGAGKAPVVSGAPQRTLADFRREHDQVWKIRDGIKRLFRGKEILTDAEFRQAVGGNPSRWRSAADMEEFRANRYRVSGEMLWAGANTINEMRKIRGEAI
jgi:hypothetical protein